LPNELPIFSNQFIERENAKLKELGSLERMIWQSVEKRLLSSLKWAILKAKVGSHATTIG